MTRVLVLNRFDLSSARYSAWMPADAEIHLLTTESSLSGAANLSSYAQIEALEHYRNSGVVEYLADAWHRRHAFDRVVATSEYDLIRAARMTTRWRLPGLSWDEVMRYRDKAAMKGALDTHAVPVTPWVAADDVLSLVEAVRTLGLPAVVKPRLGAASRGVHVLRSPADLDALVRNSADLAADRPAGLLVERYVEGTVFHVDGFVRDKQVVLCWPSETTPNLDLTMGRSLVSTLLVPEDDRRPALTGLTEQALRALGMPDAGLFHAELFATADGLLVNEIGARVGGGRIKEVMRRAFGVDPLEWYIRTLFGTPCPVPAPAPLLPLGYAKAAAQAGRVLSVPPNCPVPGVVSYYPHVGEGDLLEPPSSAEDCVATFVATGATRNEVQTSLVAATEWARAAFDIGPRDDG